MWDWSPVESIAGPLIGFLVVVVVISICVGVGWFIADSLRKGS